jgi:urease subunit gamma/beta
VNLNPTEEERLRVFTAAELARATLARGARLNAPEAVALVCDEMHHAARLGRSWDEVVDVGRTTLAVEQVLPGVADVVHEIRLEVLLDEGTRLVVLRDPFGPPSADGPGALAFGAGEVGLAPGRERIRLEVTNTSERPIRVSSHFPFADANPRLRFERAAAQGFRLDLPAGDSLEWKPGETREVALVALGGASGRPDA